MSSLSRTRAAGAHPPRVQVTENATKRIPPNPSGKTLVDLEVAVFGQNPSANKEQAIANIGNLSPEKRMWAAFHAGQAALSKKDYKSVAASINDAREAFYDWRDRTKLPRGIKVDRNADPAPTALALDALASLGADHTDPAVARGVQSLLAMQHPYGLWTR